MNIKFLLNILCVAAVIGGVGFVSAETTADKKADEKNVTAAKGLGASITGLIDTVKGFWYAYQDEGNQNLNRWGDYLVATGCPEVSATNHPEVYAMIEDLCKRAGVAMPRAFVVDPKSQAAAVVHVPEMNAFAAGFNHKVALVCIDKSMLSFMSPDEVKGILAHEMSHIIKAHSTTMQLLGWGQAAVTLPTLVVVALKTRSVKRTLGAWLGLGFANRVIARALSRRHEKEADLNAIQLAKSKALAGALTKLDEHGRQRFPFSYKQHDIMKRVVPFWLSHPTTETRLAYIEQAKLEQ